ncbi:MAG: hypothetical protein ACRD0B_11300 [Acidimicrobiales bacterium]
MARHAGERRQRSRPDARILVVEEPTGAPLVAPVAGERSGAAAARAGQGPGVMRG